MIAFLESDRPGAPRAGDAYGDNGVACQAAHLAIAFVVHHSSAITGACDPLVAKAIVRPAAGELPKAIVGQKQWRSRYQRANRDSSRGCRPGVREAHRSRERHRPGQCCGCQCEDATDGGGGWRFPRGKHERRAPGPHVAAEAKPRLERLRGANRDQGRRGARSGGGPPDCGAHSGCCTRDSVQQRERHP